MKAIDFDAPSDPLFRDVALRHVREHRVLGVPVRLECNSAHVLDVAAQSFGPGEATGPSEDRGRVRPRVRVFLQREHEGDTAPAPVEYRWPDPNRFLVATPGSVGVAEVDRREAYAFVTTTLAADKERFRSGFLEALTFMLVSWMDRHPIHAAGIVRDDVCLLLHGPSGSGKSTLTYAALRRGWKVLGDEAVYVQLEPSLRIWGMPRAIRLPRDSITHFSELRNVRSETHPSGKTKVSVRLGSDKGQTVSFVEGASVCLLRPGTAESSMRPAPPIEIEQALNSDLEPGFDMNRAGGRRVAAALAKSGGWLTNRHGNPDECVAQLEEALHSFR